MSSKQRPERVKISGCFNYRQQQVQSSWGQKRSCKPVFQEGQGGQCGRKSEQRRVTEEARYIRWGQIVRDF